MSGYTVYVIPAAWAEMRQLPGYMRQRVKQAVDALAIEPRPPSSKALRLTGTPHELRRVRLDRWRVVYLIDEAERLVSILTVRKRPPYDYSDLLELLRSLE